MKCKFLVLLTSAPVNIIVPVDELLEDAAILLADGIDEITVGMCDVHVPCSRAVPVEEIDSFLKFLLRRSKCSLQVASEIEVRQEPVPLAARVEVEGKAALLEALLLAHHEPLRVSQLQHPCQEGITLSLGAQSRMHLACMAKLLLGVLNIVNGKLIVVHTRRLGDDGIHQRTETEGSLLVTELHTGMQQVLKLG